MVEFDVVYHHHLGKVMKELGPFVEKGRVVFVALHHHEFRIRETRSLTEVRRDSSDHKTRILPR